MINHQGKLRWLLGSCQYKQINITLITNLLLALAIRQQKKKLRRQNSVNWRLNNDNNIRDLLHQYIFIFIFSWQNCSISGDIQQVLLAQADKYVWLSLSPHKHQIVSPVTVTNWGPGLPPPPPQRWELWWDHTPWGQYSCPWDSSPRPPPQCSSGWRPHWCWEPPGTRTVSSCLTCWTCWGWRLIKQEGLELQICTQMKIK